ncbi:MAG TPA: polysialyltransferase family glycosyltransferase [Flavobacteriales bacterium]|jgi:hypothetical protein
MMSFSEINAYTKEKLKDPNLYSEPEHSYLKIYQHAFRYALTERYQPLRHYFYLPIFLQSFIYRIKGFRKKIQPIKIKDYLLLDYNRVVNDNGQWHYIYYDKIIQLIGAENVSVLSTTQKTYINPDIPSSVLQRPLPGLDATELKLLKSINRSIRKARKSNLLSPWEMKHLCTQMLLFFHDFRQYYRLLKDQDIKHVILICHYHREGLFAAMKELNIEHTELQHGLIAANDLYYVYDKQYASAIPKALFPKRIVVYGPYWKRILERGCEFKPEQIFIGGDYLYRLHRPQHDVNAKENIILLCVQKEMNPDYIRYGTILAAFMKNHPDWRVIVKLHPSQDNKEEYDQLKQYGYQILDREIPLDELLAKAKIQITIYSTTVYDALGFDVMNFCLQDFGLMRDYAKDMISEGAALPLYEHEDPIAKYEEIMKSDDGIRFLPREDVYAPFQPEVFKKILNL